MSKSNRFTGREPGKGGGKKDMATHNLISLISSSHKFLALHDQGSGLGDGQGG
jgi:hypothetical protein